MSSAPSPLLLQHLRLQLRARAAICRRPQQQQQCYSNGPGPNRSYDDKFARPQSQNPNRRQTSQPSSSTQTYQSRPEYSQSRFNQSPSQPRYSDRYMPTQSQPARETHPQPQRYTNPGHRDAASFPAPSTRPPPPSFRPQSDASSPRISQTKPRSLARPASRVKDALAQSFVLDEDISSRFVIPKDDETGKLQEQETLFSLLNSIDRDTHVVRQLTKADPNDPSSVPVVQVIPRRSLQQRLATQEEQAAQRKRALRDSKPKQVELNWAISENDLNLKLKQVTTFVEKGKKVEIMLAAKKRQRRASPEEAATLVKTIKQHVDGIEGAKYTMEGKIGGQALLVVQRDARAVAGGKKKPEETESSDIVE